MPTTPSYATGPAASSAAYAAPPSAAGDAPASVVTLSPEAQLQFENGQQLVAKLTDGAKQIKAADQAFRLAAAKEKLKQLKMEAELAAATGDAKLAKSVAKDLATVSRQLGTLSQDVAQSGGAPSSDSASSTASADGSGDATGATGDATTATTATTASGATPGATPTAATDEQDVMAEIHSLAIEAKKILDYLRAAPHLRGKADKELAAAVKDVTAAVTETADGLDGSAVVAATADATPSAAVDVTV